MFSFRTVTNLVDAVEDRFISVDRRLDEISNKVDCVQASVAKQKEMIPETVPKELRVMKYILKLILNRITLIPPQPNIS